MPWASFEWGPSDGEELVPAGFVDAFAASMPSRYEVLFDVRAIRRHAAIAYRRSTRPAHVDIWRALPDGSVALCVVAEDRPGLLSAIAAALVLHRLDVITALVFSRLIPDAPAEAVDLLWVRRASPADKMPIAGEEAASIGEVLCAILSGSISIHQIQAEVSFEPEGDDDVVVGFQPSDEGSLAVLLVEAPDRPGILLTITLELFQHGAQIVRSLVRTAERRAFNRFELSEFSGAPLTFERREQIRSAIYWALKLADPGAPSEPRSAPSP